jgi:hypothetical protein
MYITFLLFIIAINSVAEGAGWDSSTFVYDVGPSMGIINGKPAYAPNPKNRALQIGNINGDLQNFTDSIYNSYVQDNQ